LNHPSMESGGSARVSNPDVPVVGRFHNTTPDAEGRRLAGEFWLDKVAFLATDEGADLYAKMLKGQPIEVSTGYFAPQTIMEHGKFNGTDYVGTHKGIHPDHIAILTNELGACSLMDGCGMNRNSACSTCPTKLVSNMTGNLPAAGKKQWEEVHKQALADGKDEATAAKIAWAACEKAGWKKDKMGKWMMNKNSQSLTDVVDTVRSAFYRAFEASRPMMMPVQESPSVYVREVFADHVIIGLGEKSFSVGYTQSKDAIEFVPQTKWVEVEEEYVPVTQNKIKQSATSLRGWFANSSKFSKEFLMQNAKLKAFLHSLGFGNVVIEDKGEDGLSVELTGQGDEKALEGLVQLNSVVQNSGGADQFAKLIESLKGLPATLVAMQTQMNEQATLVKNAASFAESVATKEAAQKGALIAGLVQNKANPFDEATLKTMSLDVLEKLEASYQPVDFSGMGFQFQNSAEEGDDKPLALPAMYLAKPETSEAK